MAIEADIDSYIAGLQDELTAPQDRECLACYVLRMLEEFGCDNKLRWARHWRDRCAPRATALERRLSDRGGYCDCEIAYNVYPELMLLEEDEPRPPCLGVARRGSTRPCRERSRSG